MKVQATILVTLVQFFVLAFGQENYEKNIKFFVHKQGKEPFKSSFCNNCTLKKECPVNEPMTILVHGWNESTTIYYAAPLIAAFHTHRGGCVMWMDFSKYSMVDPPAAIPDPDHYEVLFSQFDEINAVLIRKLKQLEELGYDPANIFMWGFSFGAYQVISAAHYFGPKKIARIDACEPASDVWVANTTPKAFQQVNASAIDVQCMHTSMILGTGKRFCPKSVNLGICGTQPNPIIFVRNHYLCIDAYISSFTNDFKLVPKAHIDTKYDTTCINRQHTPTLPSSPTYTMGYRFDFTLEDGEYYADVKYDSPHNVV